MGLRIDLRAEFSNREQQGRAAASLAVAYFGDSLLYSF
jgi:hypothetical protein